MTELADKRVGIIGTGATAVQCIPPLGRDARRAVRVPAHAVVDRRAQQPRDRTRVVRHARARLATGVAVQLRDAPDRRVRRRGPRQGRLDRHLATHPRPRARERGERRGVRPRGVPARLRGERRREDGGDPRPGWTASSRIGRPRTPSSRGTGSSASDRASTTSTCRPSTGRTSTSSTPTGAASPASTRPASGWGTEHVELDCIIFASGFEVGTEYARRSGYETTGTRRPDAVREVGRRDVVVARRARARLPEPVRHHARAGCQPHLEHHEQPRRVRPHDRVRRRGTRSTPAPTRSR